MNIMNIIKIDLRFIEECFFYTFLKKYSMFTRKVLPIIRSKYNVVKPLRVQSFHKRYNTTNKFESYEKKTVNKINSNITTLTCWCIGLTFYCTSTGDNVDHLINENIKLKKRINDLEGRMKRDKYN